MLKTVLFGLGTTVVATLALVLALRLPADAAALLGAFVINGAFLAVLVDVVLRKAGGDYDAAQDYARPYVPAVNKVFPIPHGLWIGCVARSPVIVTVAYLAIVIGFRFAVQGWAELPADRDPVRSWLRYASIMLCAVAVGAAVRLLSH